mmetsp:Transcript_17676/g.53914  ORF Transcript_17676/g.53914 Transcript_17676/m.53914 type:complete len:364 (+) Transcript_17676:628-1719(+)
MLEATEEVKVGSFDAQEPTPSLVLYGLSKFSGEAEVATALRSYAPVKDVRLLRDAHGKSRAVAFVTFYNVQAATHTLTVAAESLTIDDSQPVTLAYAKPNAVLNLVTEANRVRWQPPRRRASSSPGEEDEAGPPPPLLPTKRREWPPPFDEDGAAYTFDAASSYFYEPTSGFYYDPKAKLYYNAHSREYYRHSAPEGFRKVLLDVERQLGGGGDDKKAPVLEEQPMAPEVSNERTAAITTTTSTTKPIAFPVTKTAANVNNNNTKPSSFLPTTTTTTPAPAFALSHVLAVGTDYDQLHRLRLADGPLVRQCAKTGKWLCLVSRRQFPSEAALRKHVARSQLYKDALERAATSNTIALASSAAA